MLLLSTPSPSLVVVLILILWASRSAKRLQRYMDASARIQTWPPRIPADHRYPSSTCLLLGQSQRAGVSWGELC